MNHKNIVMSSLFTAIFILSTALAMSQEPAQPYVYTSFDNKKEAKIQELAGLSLENAFEQLKDVDFITNEDFLNKAVFIAFKDRKEEAITFVLDLLRLPRIEIVNGKKVNRTDDLFIAKKILQVFPEESLIKIGEIYASSEPVMQGNIIQALGNMAGEGARDMLVSALDDDTFCEEENPEMQGEPMRICDVAYNQLVLRYQIKDVLRTIGPAHTLEQRDYHIEVLRNKL